MVSVRRLRATLLFAILSAVVWGIIGTSIATGFELLSDITVTIERALQSATIFAVLGFIAGISWSVAVAMLPRKRDNAVTPLAATCAGTLGGVFVSLGGFTAMGDIAQAGLLALATPIAITGAIGAVAGLLIQQVASRGALTPSDQRRAAIEG